MANSQHTHYGGRGQDPSALGGSLPPGAATPSGTPPGSGGTPSSSNERGLAGVAHLSSLFAPLVVPLIIWLAVRDSMPYAARQAKQAFFFHLGLAALTLIGTLVLVGSLVGTLFAAASAAVTSDIVTSTSPPAWLFALVTFAIILGLTGQALCIYGAVQAFGGKDFSYPGLHWL
jgi:uncharacterized protein